MQLMSRVTVSHDDAVEYESKMLGWILVAVAALLIGIALLMVQVDLLGRAVFGLGFLTLIVLLPIAYFHERRP